MQEFKEFKPEISTKEELNKLYKDIVKNKENLQEDPDTMTARIIFMYNAIAGLGVKEYVFKTEDEKGKRQYKISLGQQRDDYKTIEIIYNQTTRYTCTIQEDRGTEIKIGRYSEKNEDIYVFKKEEGAQEYIEKKTNCQQTSKEETDMVMNDVYTHLLALSTPQE